MEKEESEKTFEKQDVKIKTNLSDGCMTAYRHSSELTLSGEL